MGEPDLADVAVQHAEDELAGGQGRSRGRSLVALLLILLLACGVTTIVQTYVTRSPDEIRSVVENIECLQCHTELIPDFSRDWVHDPFAKEACVTCHTPHGVKKTENIFTGASQTWRRFKTMVEWLPLKIMLDVFGGTDSKVAEDDGGVLRGRSVTYEKGEDSELTLPGDQLCWMCHGDIGWQRNTDYAHAPFYNGNCVDCHNPHASDFRTGLVMDERDLCITCHRLGPELARDQVHPPVAGRFCTNCHHPHGSQYRGILVDNQRDLCFTCHPSVAPLSTKAVQHNPFLYDQCTGCHEPHGSNYRPLLIANEPDVCYLCHLDIKNSFLRLSHHPVGIADFGCSDCHNPHAADYPGLVEAEGNEMCYQCHRAAIAVSYEASGHVDVLCIRCHTPHGSDYGPILIEPNPDLCVNCHDGFDYPKWHPVRPVYYDVVAHKGLTCTSTCHNPHGTGYEDMLNWVFPRDGGCLQCHSLVGVEF